MPTHEGFWESIRDDPVSDTPRLIYADWLEEQGDLPRAEFIRVQCRLARLDEDEDEHADLSYRQEMLLRVHGDDWRASLPACRGVEWAFRRGMPEVVTLKKSSDFVRQAAQIFAVPVLSARFYGLRRCRRLLQAPYLTRLRELELELNKYDADVITAFIGTARKRLVELHLRAAPLPPEAVELLVGWRGRERLTHLWLTHNRIDDKGCEALVKKPWPALRELDLGFNDIWPEGVEALARAASHFPALRKLELNSNPLGDRGAASLAIAEFPNLEQLDVHACGFSDTGLRSLSASALLPQLQELSLTLNRFTADGLGELGRADLSNLRELHLGSCGLDGPGLEALCRCQTLTSLRTLNITCNAFGGTALRPLESWPGMASVRRLVLYESRIGPEGIEFLARSPHLGEVRELDLWLNRLGPNGARHLAGARSMTRLRTLNLSSNSIGPEGMQALAESPHFPALREMWLWREKLGVEGAERLAAARRWPALHTLHLDYNDLGDAGVAALAASPLLEQLTTLALGNNGITNTGMAALLESGRLHPLLKLSVEGNQISEGMGVRLREQFGERVKL
jgi:uncharacterized protein (TIGR02996 family)